MNDVSLRWWGYQRTDSASHVNRLRIWWMLQSRPRALDATDDPTHGRQEGRIFHGYYGCFCYLPLYIFSGEHLLCARLRPSNVNASAGSVAELERIVAQIREHWPETELIIRGDSGFFREAIMAWCEKNGVHFVLGLAKNTRLLAMSLGLRVDAQIQFLERGEASRVFGEFYYRTRESWSRARSVVVKAEHLAKGVTDGLATFAAAGANLAEHGAIIVSPATGANCRSLTGSTPSLPTSRPRSAVPTIISTSESTVRSTSPK